MGRNASKMYVAGGLFVAILLNVASASTQNFYYHDGLQCSLCAPGTYREEHCIPSDPHSTLCKPCQLGIEYSDTWNSASRCASCNYCSRMHEHVKKNCSRLSDTVCECNSGYYLKSKDDPFCTPHTRCGIGYGVTKLGTTERDVECALCEDGQTFSDHFSTTDSCTNMTRCEEHDGVVRVQRGSIIKDNVCVNITDYGEADTELPIKGDLTVVVETTRLYEQTPEPSTYPDDDLTDRTVEAGTPPHVSVIIACTVIVVFVAVVIVCVVLKRQKRSLKSKKAANSNQTVRDTMMEAAEQGRLPCSTITGGQSVSSSSEAPVMYGHVAYGRSMSSSSDPLLDNDSDDAQTSIQQEFSDHCIACNQMEIGCHNTAEESLKLNVPPTSSIISVVDNDKHGSSSSLDSPIPKSPGSSSSLDSPVPKSPVGSRAKLSKVVRKLGNNHIQELKFLVADYVPHQQKLNSANGNEIFQLLEDKAVIGPEDTSLLYHVFKCMNLPRLQHLFKEKDIDGAIQKPSKITALLYRISKKMTKEDVSSLVYICDHKIGDSQIAQEIRNNGDGLQLFDHLRKKYVSDTDFLHDLKSNLYRFKGLESAAKSIDEFIESSNGDDHEQTVISDHVSSL